MAKKKAAAGGEDDLTKDVLDHVKNGSESTDEQKQEQARALLKAFSEWEHAKMWGAGERKRVSDKLKDEYEHLRNALEETHSGTDAEKLTKLERAEVCWQDYTDARAEAREIRSSVKDNIRLAEEKIRDLLAEQKQLGLF